MRISIFGSTGSIGKNVIELIKADRNQYEVVALVAKSDFKTLVTQAHLLQPEFVVIEDARFEEILKVELSSLKTKIYSGVKAIHEIAKQPCDLFVSAVVGAAGVIPTLNAIEAGSNIALANKESLVCAGSFIIQAAKEKQVKIIPVDSEHNAIFQVFERENFEAIDDIILTASGGPFFKNKPDRTKVTVADALKHPNWSMGAKVTIDSATMMNKGLEAIEAYHLFGLKKEQIKILIHPESIVHGIVNYCDGSSLAMLSKPDMRVPIAYALAYPKRIKTNCARLDLAALKTLNFFAPDENEFVSLKLCREAMAADGNAPVILNAANEIAVEKFLGEQIRFTDITNIVASTLERIPHRSLDSISEVVECDLEARAVARQI